MVPKYDLKLFQEVLTVGLSLFWLVLHHSHERRSGKFSVFLESIPFLGNNLVLHWVF